MEHDEYLKRREDLVKIRSSSFESFDKAILTLATGTLVLSITFLEKIGKPFNILTIILIVTTWISLFIILISNLLSYFYAQKNMDHKIKELDEKYDAQIKKGIKVEDTPEIIFWQRKATEICNLVSVGLFFISVFTFTWYAVEIQLNDFGKNNYLTYKREVTMPDRDSKSEGTSKKNIQKSEKTADWHYVEGAETEPPRAIAKPGTDGTSSSNKPSIAPQPGKENTDTLINVKKGQTEAPRSISKPKPKDK